MSRSSGKRGKWERDIRGRRRDRPQRGDELLLKCLPFSSRALHILGLALVPASHSIILNTNMETAVFGDSS